MIINRKVKFILSILMVLFLVLALPAPASANTDSIIGLIVSVAVSFVIPGAGLITGALTGAELSISNLIISSVIGQIAQIDYRSCSFNVVWSSDCPGGGGGGSSIPESSFGTNPDCSTDGCACYGPTNSCLKSYEGKLVAQYEIDEFGYSVVSGYKCQDTNGNDITSQASPPESDCQSPEPVCSTNNGQVCSSPVNSCGMANQSTYTCGGSCDIGQPADASCPLPEITLGYSRNVIDSGNNTQNIYQDGDSQTVARGQRCTINWEATPATSCTVTGPGLNHENGAKGVVQTPIIGVETPGSAVYTITCKNGNVVSGSKKFTCRMLPEYQETI